VNVLPVCYAGFTHASQPRDHRAAIGFLLEFSLNRFQHFVGILAGEMVKLSRKWPDSMNSTV
jgi:hypothetical protein